MMSRHLEISTDRLWSGLMDWRVKPGNDLGEVGRLLLLS
jgi:hypothetical protein